MSRVALTDGSHRWFDPDKAQRWEDGVRFDGHNHVSLATGSQWEHETLYRTPGGSWIIRHTSQRQGSSPSVREVGAEEAVEWLIRNDHDVPLELSEAAAASEL